MKIPSKTAGCRRRRPARREATSQEQEEDERDADADMMEELMEEDEGENGEPSNPQGAVETEEGPSTGNGLPTEEAPSTGDAISPEEDAFLMQQATPPGDSVAESHSPHSEASTVSGEMAELSLTSPGPLGPGEDETPE